MIGQAESVAAPNIRPAPGRGLWFAAACASLGLIVGVTLWPDAKIEVADTPTWYKGKPWSGNPDVIPYEIAIDMPRRVWTGRPFTLSARLRVSLSEAASLAARETARVKLQNFVAQLRFSGAAVEPLADVLPDATGTASWQITVTEPGRYFGKLWFIDPDRRERYYARDLHLSVED